MSTGDRVGVGTDASTDDQIDESTADRPTVAASRTSPERTVFTEQGNTDAWISTDLTVELER
jgi:hypothetical protein